MLAAAACAGPSTPRAPARTAAAPGTTTPPATRPATPPATPRPALTRTPTPVPPPAPPPTPLPTVEVRYRVEVRARGATATTFPAVLHATLRDPRGWSRAGFRLVHDPRADYVVVLAEADEVDRLCRPYDTYGRYSCQNGPVVALNADRWRYATPEWTGTRAAYRQMLVNHEVGHLLGMHHPPAPHCPAEGRPARVMAQQSTELDGCLPNPWPLPAEIARAARHDLPLAPPYETPSPSAR